MEGSNVSSGAFSAHGVRLLERDRELGSLDSVIRDAVAGEARVVLIEGAAGIGKTQLLGETRRRGAAAGLRILSARGSEIEREFPFGVVRQLFEPALLEVGAGNQLLEGAAGAADVVFRAVEEPAAGGTAGDASFAVLHGLFWLTVNLSGEGPLLLSIDDLHWCDHPSLRFLAYLVRRLEGLPVVVVCSQRPAEPGVDTALVAEIVGDPLTVSVLPRPLSEEAVAEVVGARLGEGADRAFSAACHSATGGNPLLLSELLKALDAEGVRPEAANVEMVEELGPRAASRAVLLRLGRLPEEAAAFAHALAVLGEGADLATIAGLAGISEDDAARAAATLVRAEIVRAEPPLGFVHPLIAASIYHDVPPGERELRHERAAQILDAAGAPAERVAAHLASVPGRGDAWAVETLRRAARSASQKGAAESAVSFLTRALEEPPAENVRSEVLLELGLAEALTHGPAAAQHLSEAYESLSDPVARGRVAGVLALTLLQTGSREEAARVAARAAADLPDEFDDLRLALKAFEVTTTLFGVPRNEDMLRLEEFQEPLSGVGTGHKLCMGMAATFLAYTSGTVDACTALCLASLAGGDVIATSNGFLAFGPINTLVFGDRSEASDAWEAAFADAHRSGSLYVISSIHLWYGHALYRRGELPEAQEMLEQALEEFGSWGFATLAGTYCAAFLGLVAIEHGDLDRARRMLELGTDTGLAADGIRYWLNARMELLVAEGNYDRAIETADVLEARFSSVANPAMGPWRSLKAQALDRLGRSDEAIELAREEVERARRWGAPWGLGRALRVLGTLERDSGLPQLEEAVEVLASSPARLEHAKALAALGTALRHARQPSDAREPLRRALELASSCGADGLAETVRAELAAAGARPRSTVLIGVEALTASEGRVAALAAEGQTNRDIAQALYVTPKTVEVHLSSAYRKLGIKSRRELASALAGA